MAWSPLLPLLGEEWDTAFFEAMVEAGLTWSVRGTEPGAAEANLWILPYMAADHDAIVDRKILTSKLGGIHSLEKSGIALVACAPSNPRLGGEAVRSLLVEQGQGVPSNSGFQRTLKPPELGAFVTSQIQKSVRIYEAAGSVLQKAATSTEVSKWPRGRGSNFL